MPNSIETNQQFADAIGEDCPVVIDFHAKWCGPCKAIASAYAALAQRYPQARFYKIDVDIPELKEVVDACQINSMPSFCFFMGGTYMCSVVGADIKAVEETVKNLIGLMNPVS